MFLLYTTMTDEPQPLNNARGYRINKAGELTIWGAHYRTIHVYQPDEWAAITQTNQHAPR